MKTDFTHSIPGQLRIMREIITKTMDHVANRFLKNPSYGWIDMKFDALSGHDLGSVKGFRDRDHVYSWIQGRGLEAITTHLKWFERFQGLYTPDAHTLKTIGQQVADNLRKARAVHGGHLPFVMDARGIGDIPKSGYSTMSDLFCARGLYAFHSTYGSAEEACQSRIYLHKVVNAIIDGNFVNDQVSFDPSQFKEGIADRTSYAARMLALGAITLFIRYEGQSKDIDSLNLGKQLIQYVLQHHVNANARWPHLKPYTLVEWLDLQGEPYRSDNHIVLDPGHALEFVGLALQMMQAWLTSPECKQADIRWIEQTIGELVPILRANLEHGYQNTGGIAKSIDAETGQIMHGAMPWWSLPETMRSLVLMGSLCNSEEVSYWADQTFARCLLDFERNYFRISASGVAVQTINTLGEPIAVIPATPDLDPGYHTGLALIDCYGVLAQRSPVTMGKAERDCTPELGIRLSGHAARNQPAFAVLDRLFVRVCHITGPYNQLLLVSADVLEFSNQWATTVQQEIAASLGIAPSGVLLTATHTHTAPPTIALGDLPHDEKYLEKLYKTIMEACYEASQKQQVVQISVGNTQSDIGINRRVYAEDLKRFVMRPNPSGERDDDLSFIAFSDIHGALSALWFGIAVHPTTLGVGICAVSADYPGRTIARIKQVYGPDCLVVPLLGACGDVRPALLSPDGNSFREGTESDIDAFGTRIAQKIIAALPSAKKLSGEGPLGFPIRHALRTVRFPLRNVPNRTQLHAVLQNLDAAIQAAQKVADQLDDFTRSHDNPVWALKAQKAWAQRLINSEQPLQPYVEGDMMALCMGDRLLVFTLPGELFSAVGKRIKKQFPHQSCLLVCYTGGSLGYFPSFKASQQGGYETEEAFKYYGVPGPFSEALEDIILEAIGELAATIGIQKTVEHQ